MARSSFGRKGAPARRWFSRMAVRSPRSRLWRTDGLPAVAGDGTIKLWPREGMGEPVVLQHGSEVWSLAVLADGRLASGGLGGKIKLWLVDERKLLAALCLRAGRNFTNDEWPGTWAPTRRGGRAAKPSDSPQTGGCRIKAFPREEGRYERGAASLRRRVRRDAYRSGNLFLDLEPERGRKHCIWVIFSMEVNLRNVYHRSLHRGLSNCLASRILQHDA